jgi:hypothetical protein
LIVSGSLALLAAYWYAQTVGLVADLLESEAERLRLQQKLLDIRRAEGALSGDSGPEPWDQLTELERRELKIFFK